MNRAFFFLFALLASRSVAAENELFRLPSGDFICTVEVTPQAGGIERTMKKIVITQTGNVRRDAIVWSNQETSEVWSLVDENLSILEEEGPDGRKNIYVMDGGARESVCPRLLHFTADSLSWIQDKTRVLSEKQSAQQPIHYKATFHKAPADRISGAAEPTIPAAPQSITYQAWIDPVALLPVKLEDDEALYTLTYAKEKPASPLVFPERFQGELKRWQGALKVHPHR